jgi:hypothetical protein
LVPFLGRGSAQTQPEAAIEDGLSPLCTPSKIKKDKSCFGGNVAGCGELGALLPRPGKVSSAATLGNSVAGPQKARGTAGVAQ